MNCVSITLYYKSRQSVTLCPQVADKASRPAPLTLEHDPKSLGGCLTSSHASDAGDLGGGPRLGTFSSCILISGCHCSRPEDHTLRTIAWRSVNWHSLCIILWGSVRTNIKSCHAVTKSLSPSSCRLYFQNFVLQSISSSHRDQVSSWCSQCQAEWLTLPGAQNVCF